MYKTHPKLWQQILDATTFLPADAKPKQRVWHILNDVYARPTCPVTGKYVKWWENRYLGTADRSAKTQLSHKNGLYKNCYTEEINQKRSMSNKERVKKGRRYRGKATPEELERRKKTNLERYGVECNLSLPENKQKEYQTKVAKGLIIPREDRNARDLYYESVRQFTQQSWTEHFDKINPKRINRGNDWHLDHIYSKQAGFRNNIPPYIIGHWTNLQMLPGPENSSKGMKCNKTKEQLFEDVFKS